MRLPSVFSALKIPHHPCTASWEIKSLILLISFSKITQSQDTSANYSSLKNFNDKGKITHFFLLQKTSLLVWVRTIWHDNVLFECLVHSLWIYLGSIRKADIVWRRQSWWKICVPRSGLWSSKAYVIFLRFPSLWLSLVDQL